MNILSPNRHTGALGKEVRAARQYRRLTQKALAAAAGVDLATLQKLEAGRGTVCSLSAVLATLGHRFSGQPEADALGPWLTFNRRSARLSQQRLCSLAGVSKPSVIQVERGRGHVSTLVAVISALGLSLAFRRVEDSFSHPGCPASIARMLEGDCRNHMRQISEEGTQFDAIVCDPPYHLSIDRRLGGKRAAPLSSGEPGTASPYRSMATGFMGQGWDGGDIAFDVETWRAAYAVLKPGGYIVAFGGTRTFHRLAVAIEDAGFEIRDTIMWLFGSGFPKSHNVGRGIEVLKRGNARYSGRTMPSEQGGLPPGKLLREMANSEWTGRVVRLDDHAAQRWQGHGTALKPAYEPILIARKPICERSVAANVLKFGTGGINIDACRVPTEEVIEIGRAGRKRGLSVALEGPGLPPTAGGKATRSNGRWPANVIHDGIDETWGRYFYTAKASKVDRGAGNGHPTVKPNDLMRYLVRLVTPAGGTVFDPFCGSGSSGVAAVQEGFNFVGCEMIPEYVEIAERRIAAALSGRTNSAPITDDSPQAAT